MRTVDIVHTVAGALVALSAFLTVFVNTKWALLSIFIGVNLFQYGFTRWCLMEKFIAKLGVKTAIDFACEEFSVEDILKCSLGLSKGDLRVLLFLLRNKTHWCSTEELAKKLDLDVTTIQRAVKKLSEKDVLLRRQQNLPGGGYTFLYQRASTEHIHQTIISTLQSWVARAETEVRSWR